MIIIKRFFNFVFLVGLLSAVIYHFRDSWQSIWLEVLQTSPLQMSALCIITALYFIFDSLITHSLASSYNENITFKDSLFWSFYCIFLGIATMGSGAGIGEIYYFHNKGLDSPVAGGICIIKYFLKKIVIVLYGLLGFAILYVYASSLVVDYRLYLLFGTVLAFLIILFLFALLTWSWFSHILFTILKKYITYKKWNAKIVSFEKEIMVFQSESKKILKNSQNTLIISILNFCKLTCMYVFPLFYFLTSIDMQSFFTVVMIMAISNMLAGVIPTPYGFGSLEFICFMLYGQIISNHEIISMLLLFRFFTDILPLAIGGLCFLFDKRKQHAIADEHSLL